MQNRRFHDAVSHRLINIQVQQSMSQNAVITTPSVDEKYKPSDVIAIVDYQNFHYFLKENCRVPANQVHLPNLLREFAILNCMPLTELHVVTGIHDPRKEHDRFQSMIKKLNWLEKNDVKVKTLPLYYQTDPETGSVTVREKGVDVYIGSAIFKAVANERHKPFTAYSLALTGMKWAKNGKCGVHGIAETEKLLIDVDFVKKYVRAPKVETSPEA